MYNYWINSNTGDYIYLAGGKYFLNLIARKSPYMSKEIIEITKVQAESAKGFLPIKTKKFLSSKRNRVVDYRPTLKGGVKGKSERYNIPIPTQAELRDVILKKILG